jgi:hypothetical protein
LGAADWAGGAPAREAIIAFDQGDVFLGRSAIPPAT